MSSSPGQYRPATFITAAGVIIGVIVDTQGDLIHRQGSEPSVVGPGDETAAARLALWDLATA